MRLPTAIAASTLLVGAGAASASAAPLTAHAVFSGGARAPFHVGQPVQVSLSGADRGAAVARTCWTPSPVGQPACGPRIAALAHVSYVATTAYTIIALRPGGPSF